MIENCSLCLNELLRASCPPPFGPAELFKFVPDELVRKNLAANLVCQLSPDLIHMEVMYASNAGAFTCSFPSCKMRANPVVGQPEHHQMKRTGWRQVAPAVGSGQRGFSIAPDH